MVVGKTGGKKWKFHWSERNALDELLLSRLPNCPGLYKIYRADGKLLYVGETKAVAARLSKHLYEPDNEVLRDYCAEREQLYFSWAKAPPDENYRKRVEAKIIREEKPEGNLLYKAPWYMKIWRWIKSNVRDKYR